MLLIFEGRPHRTSGLRAALSKPDPTLFDRRHVIAKPELLGEKSEDRITDPFSDSYEPGLSPRTLEVDEHRFLAVEGASETPQESDHRALIGSRQFKLLESRRELRVLGKPHLPSRLTECRPPSDTEHERRDAKRP